MAYLDKTTYLLVDDPKKIAWKYTRSWFVFDFISTIPSELARKISPKPFQSYGLFNMLRLWRLRRVSALFSRLEKDRNYNYFWVRCAKLICVSIQVKHGFSMNYNSSYSILLVCDALCRSLFSQFTLLDAFIILLLLVILTLKRRGLEHLWGTIFFNRVYGSDM